MQLASLAYPQSYEWFYIQNEKFYRQASNSVATVYVVQYRHYMIIKNYMLIWDPYRNNLYEGMHDRSRQ